MAAIMCSGQGAQKPGMGADLLDEPEVKEAFACASDAFGLDLAVVVQSDDVARIDEARASQAATVALSVGVGRALMARGLDVAGAIGFSLGQISALCLADALSLEQTFSLLNVRADAMARACAAQPGAMLALLGADEQAVRALCAACAEDGVLVPANYNCPGQIVVSGDVAAIGQAEARARGFGMRARRLNTAGAFHSPLMAQAADELRAWCEKTSFAEPRFPVICNTDATPFVVGEAADRLSRHLVSPVRFDDGIRTLMACGQTRFIEAGFGGVLFNLVKRIDATLMRERIGTRDELDAFVA